MGSLIRKASGLLGPHLRKGDRVAVIGSGNVAMDCLRTAKRLGAKVTAFDTRPVVAEQVQSLGAKLLKNQVPETIFLADQARHLGAAAASAFGAGFGGSVWALVRDEQASEIQRQWSERYADAFPHRAARAAFFRCGPSLVSAARSSA